MKFLTTSPSPSARLAATCAVEWTVLTPELVRERFTEAAIYENRLSTPTIAKGPEKIYRVLDDDRTRTDRVEGTLLDIAESGDVVLLERDQMTYLKTGKSGMVPVMDSFQFRGNQISAWREYWDLATLTDHTDESF